jgi:hypothetical protein
MAILRSVDGKFYEVPDDSLANYLVPDDQVKAKLSEAGCAMPAGRGPGPGRGPGASAPGAPGGVVIQIYTQGQQGDSGPPPGRPPAQAGQPEGAAAASGQPTEVSPYGFCFGGGGWHNCWHNHWHNCWHNHWANHWHNCY